MPVAELQHATLGRVVVNTRHNSRHISARWKSGLVSLNVPNGVRLPDIHRVLDALTPRLLASRPEVSFYDGQELCFPLVDFVIRTQRFAPAKILGTASYPVSSVEVGSDWDFDLDTTSAAISDMLCKVARKIAPQVLVPRAKMLASKIGRCPVGWTISSGHRILGQCSSHGIISLSYILVFMPEHLCDYIIYHELAHLTEMNHGERFHTLLNQYLEGREATLSKELQRYSWPVFRK